MCLVGQEHHKKEFEGYIHHKCVKSVCFDKVKIVVRNSHAQQGRVWHISEWGELYFISKGCLCKYSHATKDTKVANQPLITAHFPSLSLSPSLSPIRLPAIETPTYFLAYMSEPNPFIPCPCYSLRFDSFLCSCYSLTNLRSSLRFLLNAIWFLIFHRRSGTFSRLHSVFVLLKDNEPLT